MRSGAPATCVGRSTPSARARLRRVRRAGGVALGSAGGCSTSPRCPARPCSYGLDTAAAASTAAGRGLALSLELDPRPWKLACSWKLMLRPRGMLWESESSPHQRPSPHTHLRHAFCDRAKEVSIVRNSPATSTPVDALKHASNPRASVKNRLHVSLEILAAHTVRAERVGRRETANLSTLTGHPCTVPRAAIPDRRRQNERRDEAASDHGSDDRHHHCVHASYRASAPPLS